MPCLNEAETIAACVDKAARFLERAGITARSSSPTTAAPTARRPSPSERARASSPSPTRLRRRSAWAASRPRAARYVIMGDADDSYDFSNLDALRRQASRRGRPGHGQPLRRRHRAGRHAAAAPLHRQPGALCRPPCSSGRRSATSTAGCAALSRSAIRSSTCGPPAWSSPPRWSSSRRSKGSASPRCRRRWTRTAGHAPRTCGPGATAGATCDSC